MQYQPQQQAQGNGRAKRVWISAIVSGVSSGLIAMATFFAFKKGPEWLKKRDDFTQGLAVGVTGLTGGPIIGTLAARMFGRKKEEKSNDADQIVMAQKNIEQGLLGLLAESAQALNQLSDECETQMKSHIQQLQAAANAPGMVPSQAQQNMPEAFVPPQPSAPSVEMMNGNTAPRMPQPRETDSVKEPASSDTQAFASPASVQVGSVQQAGMRSPAGREMERQQEGVGLSQDR
jgi:formiminotetrahydrofolate cyclodeaminase